MVRGPSTELATGAAGVLLVDVDGKDWMRIGGAQQLNACETRRVLMMRRRNRKVKMTKRRIQGGTEVEMVEMLEKGEARIGFLGLWPLQLNACVGGLRTL